MSILDAVIILASVVKQIADDASANSTLCSSLAARVEMVPRVLKKFPDASELDEDLLQRMYGFLKVAHDLITSYKSKGTISRMLMASSMRGDFEKVETNIGRCIDDLSFNVGVASAAKIDAIRADFQKEFPSAEGEIYNG